MTDEAKDSRQDPGSGEGEERQRPNARERMSEGFSRGLGVLSAFKEALDETIAEARERGDLSVDRAREAMKGAMGRARDVTSEARDRFDFVSQAEFAALVKRVRELEGRLGIESPEDGDGAAQETRES